MLQSAKSWRTITQRTYLKYFCCSTFSFISSSINLMVFDFSVSDMKSEGQLRFEFSLFPSFSSNSRSVPSQLLNNHCQCFIYTNWNEVCELQNMDSRKILCTKTRFDLFLGNSFSLNLRMLFNSSKHWFFVQFIDWLSCISKSHSYRMTPHASQAA